MVLVLAALLLAMAMAGAPAFADNGQVDDGATGQVDNGDVGDDDGDNAADDNDGANGDNDDGDSGVTTGDNDGIVYAAGGRSGGISAHRPRLDAYDPTTGRWFTRASMPTSRAGAAGAVLDGRPYVFGGEGNEEDATGVFSETGSYDPAEDRWSTHPSMPTARHGNRCSCAGRDPLRAWWSRC